MKIATLISALVLALLSVLSVSVNAEILQIEFTDTLGKAKTITPQNNEFLNLSTPPVFIVGGGLDRKIRVRLLTSSDSLIEEITTGVIGVSDRLTVSNKDYYGKRIETTKTLLEIAYKAEVDLLDIQGVVISTDTYNFTVDATPPVITGQIKFSIKGMSGGNVNIFDYLEQREFYVDGISDASSGLDSAVFFATLDGSTDEKSLAVNLDPATGIASWLKPTNYRTLFYQNRSDYNIGFKIIDKAGNEARVSQNSAFNGVCGTRKVTDIWNPSTAKWDKYTAGMTVFENPFKFRVGVPLSEHVTTNGIGRFGYNFGISSQDSQYAYRDLAAYYPPTYRYYTFYTDAGYCGSVHQSNASVKLAPGVDEAPKSNGLSYLVDGEDNWINSTNLRRNKPYTVKRVILKAASRSYKQNASLSGFGACTIPVGQTSCEIVVNHVRSAGTGYVPYGLHLGASDGGFPNSHVGYFYTYWDFNAPEIQNITHNEEQVTFDVYASDAVSDWRRGWWLPATIQLKATNNSTGIINYPPLIESFEPNYQLWSRTHSLKSLPEGDWKLEAYVKDTYGNERTVLVANTFWRDATAPTAQFVVEGVPLGDMLKGLENLRIIIADPNNPEITSVQLVGGPTSDDVYLVWTKVSGNEYKLEYPRIFPAPDSSTGYEIRVSVKDGYANTATHKATFAYLPANLIEVDNTQTLPVPVVLKNKQNQPIGSVKSNVLRTDTGSIATGNQSVYFTLRGDSPFAVSFANETIAAGETKVVLIDLGDIGVIDEAITPSESGIEGVANYMIDIPQLTSRFD